MPSKILTASRLLADQVRLRREFADALFEVEASREQLLEAGYEERRRLETDLHDGAQQRLVSLGMRRRAPEVGVLMLSQHVETRLSVELVATGRFGYLLKDRVLDVDEFVDALSRVAAGGSALDPEVVARLLAGGRDSLSALTPRELEVLALMAEGLANPG